MATPKAQHFINRIIEFRVYGRPAPAPKVQDLSLFSQDQLDDIAMMLNSRIRKSLGWKAPAELFLPKGAFNFQKYWQDKINQNVALGS